MKSEFAVCTECGEEYRVVDRTLNEDIIIEGLCPGCRSGAIQRNHLSIWGNDDWEGNPYGA